MPAIQMGGDASRTLQIAIQKELARLGYSESEDDPVMAEYITIMLINEKTPDMITEELTDLIGADYNSSFTAWLFDQYQKVVSSSEPAAPEPASPRRGRRSPEREHVPETDEPAQIQTYESRNARPARNTFQQAVNATAPPTGTKRTSSMRSPSPTGSGPNKQRRLDGPPTGPRRTLADRLGPPPPQQHQQNFVPPHGMPQQGMPPMPMGMPQMGMMPGMDISMMNPVALQEMLGAQMALMTHVAMNMGLVGAGGQFITPAQQQQMQQQQGQQGAFQPAASTRGRGGAAMGRGRGGAAGRNGAPSGGAPATHIAAPQPIVAAAPAGAPAFTPPSRPQSPTLCKFNTKCTNPTCRYSHASPVATVESGLVLNVDACEKGKECKDPDCPKSHVSPALLNPSAAPFAAKSAAPSAPSAARVPCKFGANCTRAGCTFSHPPRPRGGGGHHAPAQQNPTPCKFGSGCTRAECPFQHPSDRVLPGTFHRGLDANTPLVSVPTPSFHTAFGHQSHNRSTTFNNNKSLDASAKPFVPNGQQVNDAAAKDESAAAAAS
ncbi:hypothetical protein BKA62DRAFT_829609 [Auriculariales sp. MPI-PUGE-AT-0066]|nr:hypothetical protein BKA62DRAFT_829609 [Auriculariales sp. MPI-PUGE-AT-0066]